MFVIRWRVFNDADGASRDSSKLLRELRNLVRKFESFGTDFPERFRRGGIA